MLVGQPKMNAYSKVNCAASMDRGDMDLDGDAAEGWPHPKKWEYRTESAMRFIGARS